MSAQSYSAKAPILLGVITLLVLIGGFGSWAVLTNISGAVITSGVVEVDRNRQVIQHPDGGVVMDIAVKEGDSVAAGDVLLRLDDTVLRSRLNVIEGQYYELRARRARLAAERDNATALSYPAELLQLASSRPDVAELLAGQRRLFLSRRDTLNTQIAQLHKRSSQIMAQIDGIDAQSSALNAQLGLLQEELSQQSTLLEKGLTQSSKVLSLKRDEAGLRGQIGELAAARAEAQGRMTEIDLQITQLSSQRREDAISQLRDQDGTRLDLAEQRLTLIEKIKRLSLRAPVSGVVLGLTVHTKRAVLRAAEPLMYLVPQDRPLVISAQISPLHVDEVFVGQDVRLKFNALASRNTPDLKGQVITVSPDAFQDEKSGQKFYRAEIHLAAGELTRLPRGAKLKPGMPVTAYIRTADRTPFAYLSDPMADFFAKAFRGR